MLSADDRLAILDVVARYNRFADERDVEGTVGLYGEDGFIDGDFHITDELRTVDGAWKVHRHHVAIDPAMRNAIAQAQDDTVA